MQFSSIWLIERTLLGAPTLGQSGSESDGSEGVLHIPQSSNITDFLVSYQDTHWGGYPYAEKPSVYFTAPANQVIKWG